MGDRGGKKDKEKHQQQQVKKHQQEAQRKQDKALPKNTAQGRNSRERIEAVPTPG